MTGVRFVLLDGVAAWRGRRPLRIGPPQRRAVLTALLLNAGRVMSTDQLVAAVWGSAAPDKAAATLHALISALRKALQPDLAPRERGELIQTIDRGYLIDPADIDLDVLRFNTELADAQRAKQRGDLSAARVALCAALDRCRGTALATVPGPLAARHRCLLGRARLIALENLVEIDLATKQVPRHDLSGALAANPHRERLHALHIRLLAAGGRKAEALAAYTRIRQVLITDLGVEPGVELRRLHQQILAGDRPGPVHVPRVRRGADDEQRPGAVPHQPVLLGRAGALAELVSELAGGMGPGPSVVLLHGIAGVGKTATAAWAAHRFAARWPDGRFFLSADADDTQRAAVRRAMANAPRSLLVLDDVTSAAQVRQMILDHPTCSVLLTSRYRGAQLPHTGQVELTPLTDESVIELLAKTVGTVRVTREPEGLTRLVDATKGIPALVLSVAEALRARPGSSLADFANQLLAKGGPLELHLRALFDRCYSELDPVRAKVLRAAAGQTEPTGVAVAAATELPQWRVDALLIDLVDRGLLEAGYRFPPLVREYVLARTREIEPLAEMCARVAKLTRHLVLDGARAATLVRPTHRPVLRGPRR